MTNEHNTVSLNKAQENAARAPAGPLLIVAGAGTGKTRTLTSRILYLIEQGMRPSRICAITFTNKAANEMSNRLSLGGVKPYIGTFHSLGAKILRKECRAFGRGPNFTIFDDHDSFNLIKKAVRGISRKKDNDEEDDIKPAKKDEAPAFFAQKIAEIKNGVFMKEGARARISPEKEFQIRSVFEAYEAALQRNNAFDFDDLIQKPVLLFQKDPAVLKKYQGLFDAVLVDEWQDINPMQYELVKSLAGGHRNLSVVGDDEQTIYTWRYASIKIFLNFDKDWNNATIHFLEENYRSTSTIINAAQAVAQNNRIRTPKKLWTSNSAGDLITLFEAWGENDEAAWIAKKILNSKFKILNESIAILYRTNAQSRAIEQALIRENISYRIFGGLKFYERREVKDAVAALRYAANTKDELSIERLEKNLSKKKFAEFRERVMAEKNQAPAEILNLFLEAFGYFDYLEQNFTNANERTENISELAIFASEFKTLAEMLEKISLVQSTDAPSSGTSEAQIGPKNGLIVHLSTIHLAKGLEFDTVFIAGAAEGILPHIRSIDNDDSLEEERRLMYVAMTRARKKLFISFFGMPSRFLSEIPREYLRTLSEEDEKSDNDRDGIDPEPEGENYLSF
ncbi:MAG: UvrD-helicase domain-containing protein [Minisyncoccia bacterium]|jgi:DNA helicase-2/ATP-dependent DNA helicase PcrA